jgi:hypothetical protein
VDRLPSPREADVPAFGISAVRQHDDLIDRTALASVRGNANALIDARTITAHSPPSFKTSWVWVISINWNLAPEVSDALFAFTPPDGADQIQFLAELGSAAVGVFDATKILDDFARMVQTLPARPVIIVDFPARATDFLLSAAKHFRLMELFEEALVRPTLLIFAAEDPSAPWSAY